MPQETAAICPSPGVQTLRELEMEKDAFVALTVLGAIYAPSMSKPLSSINQLHDTGRKERKNIAFDAGVIFFGGLFVWIMLIFLLWGPDGLISIQKGGTAETRLLLPFVVTSLDPAGTAQFVALAGVVLALNRFDRHSPEDLGMEDAIRLWTRLDFRLVAQFILTLVAATAPYRAISWVFLHISKVGWDAQAAASIGSCVILWLLLLLAGPTSTFFGLQQIQREWHIANLLHKAGLLERAWGGRWGQDLYGCAAPPRLSLRLAGNWFTIAAFAIACVVATGLLLDPGFRHLRDPRYIQILFVIAVYLGVLGLGALCIGIGLALCAWKSKNEGRVTSSRVARISAFGVPLLFTGGSAAAVGPPYLPVLSGILFVGWVQLSCVRGLLHEKPLTTQSWNPIRRLVLNLRFLSQKRAHLRCANPVSVARCNGTSAKT